METVSISTMLRDDVEAVARLHCVVLREGFLPQLDPAILVHTYAAAVGDPATVALVLRSEREIAGFLLATTDARALFRRVLGRRGLPLALVVLRAIARRPSVIWRVLETFRYSARRSPDAGTRREAELVSIGILAGHRGKGYGAALIRALNAEFARRGVRSYTVAVYSDNGQGNGLYRQLGFELAHAFEMYGRSWRLYRLRVPAAITSEEAGRTGRGGHGRVDTI